MRVISLPMRTVTGLRGKMRAAGNQPTTQGNSPRCATTKEPIGKKKGLQPQTYQTGRGCERGRLHGTPTSSRPPRVTYGTQATHRVAMRQALICRGARKCWAELLPRLLPCSWRADLPCMPYMGRLGAPTWFQQCGWLCWSGVLARLNESRAVVARNSGLPKVQISPLSTLATGQVWPTAPGSERVFL